MWLKNIRAMQKIYAKQMPLSLKPEVNHDPFKHGPPTGTGRRGRD